MKSVDKVIQILKEMMVANAPGSGSGFSTKSPEEGPVAGKDILIGTGVRKRYIYGGRKSRKNWIDHFNKKS
jgi:hypothetical protein